MYVNNQVRSRAFFLHTIELKVRHDEEKKTLLVRVIIHLLPFISHKNLLDQYLLIAFCILPGEVMIIARKNYFLCIEFNRIVKLVWRDVILIKYLTIEIK